ncbi:DNA primase [Wolbachia pipientis]|uniref:DNA primase n=1 Tax=Wolbachia pipientis TaxID=955 RepID=A0A1E7QJ86_WOLPI|nr:DNA primase [Wolbachia pipientis]OEY86542.1 DNA primase [Wolbachia pipientis]
MDYINLIKSRLLLSDVVSQKVKLIRRGNNFVGLCPFHREKTPSFSVTDTKGLYYCFGCSAHGDIFEFISQTEGLNFKDAVQRLASIAGVELPKKTYVDTHNKFFSILELAANWFTQNNRDAMHYLKQRRISNEIIEEFKIGYAPNSGLKQHLNSLGIEDSVLTSVGLITKNYHDYFHDRLIFPIYNIFGKIIAFGGRALNNTQHPKYLNSPENRLFKKKENLYGLNLALAEIRKKQNVFVVEGYTDVIALHQAGITNTVAPLGTAISLDQIRSLWKFTNEISICMDGDNAGYNASIRIAELALSILEPGYTLKFITLPSDKDPYDICDEMQYKGQDVLTILNNLTMLHSEYLWNHINTQYQYITLSPERSSMIEHKFIQYINAINSINIRRYYKNYFYSKINSKNLKKQTPIKSEYLHNKSPELIQLEQNQMIILRIIMEFPAILNHPIFFEQFSDFEFTDVSLEQLQHNIINLTSKDKELNKAVLLEHSNIVNIILQKTQILNSQLIDEISAKNMWHNVMLLQELSLLEQEKTEARLSGNLDIEAELIIQIEQIKNSIQEMQMKFIKTSA